MGTLVYFDGKFVREEEAKLSIFDIGFMYGAVFMEAARTFKHKLYKLDEHLERLDKGMRYAGLNALVTRDEMRNIMNQTVEANIANFEDDNDCWICAEVTPGLGFPHPLMKGRDPHQKPTVIAYVSALPFDEYAQCYAEGKPAVVSHIANVPPSVVDPRAKTRFRLHYFMAKLDASSRDPDAFALLLDTQGYVTEGTGANIMIVSNGVLYTPTTRNILDGISRRTVMELARELEIPVVERDLTLYDLYNADEGFWTTSSYCMLPLSRVDHVRIGKTIPGPITERILAAWSQKVGVDIVGQAMKYRSKKSNVWRDPDAAAANRA